MNAFSNKTTVCDTTTVELCFFLTSVSGVAHADVLLPNEKLKNLLIVYFRVPVTDVFGSRY